MADINTVIESYADYLAARNKPLWRRFQKTRRDAPESAMAEAAVFRVLQQCGTEPEVADMVNKGGPDFHCVPQTPGQFMVEATSFLPRKITDDTALQNLAPDEVTVHAFSLLTRQIDEKATHVLVQREME